MILSIIVPSYNSEKYISKYEKLFYRKELEGEVEFIFVNDGSKDGTAIKLSELCSKHPNYFYLFSKENGGHGSTINFGINKVKGLYFKVIDADDFIYGNNLFALVDNLKKQNADAVITDYVELYEDTGTKIFIKPTSRFADSCMLDESEMSKLSDFRLCFHSMVFKTSVWKEHSIVLREKVFYEDQEFFMYPLYYIKSFSYFNFPFYAYVKGNEGQSVSLTSYRRNRKDHSAVMNDLLIYYEKNFAGSITKECIDKNMIIAIYNHFCNILIQEYNLRVMRIELFSFYRSISKFPSLKSGILKYSKLVLIMSIVNFRFCWIWKRRILKKYNRKKK